MNPINEHQNPLNEHQNPLNENHNSLDESQKQLLFEYCLGLTSETENAQAQELVFSNEQAARLVKSIKASLSPLDSIATEQCPEELAEGTIWRAQQVVRTGKVKLTQLIAAEQGRKTGAWRDIFGRLATAAIFVIVGIAGISGWKTATFYARQHSWQNQCQGQLAGLFNSLSNYRNDNNGQMPAVSTEAGAPWWRVGYQGDENVSNTRRMWILVRNGYAQPDEFMCPGFGKCTFIGEPRMLNDFPSRQMITFSFRIGCPTGGAMDTGRKVIISDMNPIFAELPPLSQQNLAIQNLAELLRKNSPNHAGRGQNILFCDGSVTFFKTRTVNNDDIFTLQNAQTYQGTELPTSEKDAFLAP
jgi:prepilin-type processing-associated H-X9-DG protein